MPTTHATFSDAYTQVARDLLERGRTVSGVTDPHSIGSLYGKRPRDFREILGYSFTLADPLATVIDSCDRSLNLPFLIANIVWTVAGSDKVSDIQYWNHRALTFSDDGVCLRSAPGARIFASSNQYGLTLDRLTSDRSSRRAVMLFIDREDLCAATVDVPCIQSMQLFVRDGALYAVGIMRSQSALMVMPYDVPLLTALQAALAADLGIGLGTYTHVCASMHYYLEEEGLAKTIAEGTSSFVRLPQINGREDIAGLASLLCPDSMPNIGAESLATLLQELPSPFQSACGRVLLGEIAKRQGLWNLQKQFWQETEHFAPLLSRTIHHSRQE